MSENTDAPKTAEPASSESPSTICSASLRCPQAHDRINRDTEVRPFNADQERDGNWHYVHRCAAHLAAQHAWMEGVTSLAAWLVDNAEGEEITEELLLQWSGRCIKETDPMRDLLQNAKGDAPGAIEKP